MAGTNERLNDLKKYLAYFFETDGFTTDNGVQTISQVAREAARQARGNVYGPAVMVHGIMPRSGTVYIGELLRRHPDLYAYPHQLWEVPALQLTGQLRRLQDHFLRGYKPNLGKLGDDDFVAVFGASIMAYLHQPVPSEKRLLIKMPSVQYLNNFYSMFPFENLLILVRDGRDLVHSTLRTWKRLNFVQVCLRWNRSARIVLKTRKMLQDNGFEGYLLVRYEDALRDAQGFVTAACNSFGLDPSRYPFDSIDSIKVIGSSKLEQNVTWQFIKRPKNFAPVGYWENWSALRKTIFKAIAGHSLVELGYSEDLNW